MSLHGNLWNIRNLRKTHIKLKYLEVSFTHNFILSCSIVLKIHTEHGSNTAVPRVTFQND